jgi:very-short-patch-repair endonuclease
MQETILSRLEASRKELLDLGLRNPLLNYKTSKARGLHIVQEKSVYIYDILVKQNKSMTFLGMPEKAGEEDEASFPALSQPEAQEAYQDTKLQTSEVDLKLQVKLLNTYYFAKTSIEEQGVNTLYLSLGMLNWYEEGNDEDVRLSPLLLIPVSLERSSANERFRLKYTGVEIGANLSLQAKMMADFNITIPGIPENDDFGIEQYFVDIRERITRYPSWKIDADAMELGFFSFGKFMIYHDLDSSKWPENELPYNHPNINALFTDGFKDAEPTATEEDYLDTDTVANELFQVVDADSSQVLAMLAVHEGRNMVIQGPPGTGKSQTITNMIANAIGHGKKVLFVAEKMAALDVVKRRLDAINLGEACLELHSHKANKKELHEELKRVLELGKPTFEALQQELALLEAYRTELNEYCSAVNNAIIGSGLSAQKVIGFLLAIAKTAAQVHLPKIPIEQIEQWDANRIGSAEAIADRIQARLTDIGIPSKLLFWGSRLTVLFPHEEQSVQQILSSALQALKDLLEVAETIAGKFGVAAPKNRIGAISLLELRKLAAQSPDLEGINIKTDAWLLNQRDITELLETGKQFAALRREYNDILMPEAWEQNVVEMRRNFMAYGDKWYRFLIGAYGNSKKQLAAMSKAPIPSGAADKIKMVDAISESRWLQNILNELEPLAARLFGSRWLKQRSDWDSLTKVAAYLEQLHSRIAEGTVPHEILEYLAKGQSQGAASTTTDLLTLKLQDQQQSLQVVIDKLQINLALRWPGTSLDQVFFQVQQQTIENWVSRFPELQKMIAWNNLAKVASDEGLSVLINASLEWEGAREHLKTALQKTWYEYLIERAFSFNPALIKFERASHEEVLEKFKKLDLLNLHYNRARVALKHWEGVPRQQAGGQVNILRSEFNKKSRLMPIRKLVSEAGLAVQAIKPVIMMSPMSIANFFAPGSIEFDLVIFDEASQVRPVEALGAIARAKQLVVVGDSKQLPPTSFFDKMNTDIEDEDNVTADLQSILGMCDAQGAPQRMLRWHYRSRHESLISLSNKEFYENKLVIFPSPGSRTKMGLVFHYLENAVYDRGKTRTNPLEAEAVADAVIHHALNNPKQSLGVVAFSTAQMQCIQNTLEGRRRKSPEVENFFRSHAHEPFFVKNLENVQGDERDVIFISIGYGKTEEGKIPMSFGPLNNEGGERRLNVLITRAKLRCEVFTNITSEDIKPTESTRFGIRALKSFLYFAQHGRFDELEETIVTQKRPFEDEVAGQLTAKGYTVRKKVGSEGFYIDMAIVDAKNPGRYIIGIECDGEAYASAKSARDRDRLRQQVMETMGWKIFRIWSTDWFRNPKHELERLVTAIEKARELTEHDDIDAEGMEAEIITVNREQGGEIKTALPPYILTTLPAEVAAQEMHLHSFAKLAGWITAVVNTEGPVHFDEMARRMADAAGVSKVGSRIRYTITQAAQYAKETRTIKANGDFLWPADMETPVLRDRSALSSTSKKLQYIAPEEIDLAIQKVVEEAIGIHPEAAVPFIAKLLGFSRVTEDLKNDIMHAIDLSLEKKSIVKDGEFLKRT